MTLSTGCALMGAFEWQYPARSGRASDAAKPDAGLLLLASFVVSHKARQDRGADRGQRIIAQETPVLRPEVPTLHGLP